MDGWMAVTSLADLQKQAEAALKAGGPKAAADLLLQAWTSGLRDATLAVWLKSLMAAQGNAAAAGLWHRKAISLRPEDPALWNAQGLEDFSAGRHSVAIGSFLQAIRLAPDVPAYRLNAAITLRFLNDLRGTVREAEAAIRLAGQPLPDACLILAQAALQRGDVEAALGHIVPLEVGGHASAALSLIRAGIAELQGAFDDALLLLVSRADEIPQEQADLAARFGEILSHWQKKDPVAARAMIHAQGFFDPSSPHDEAPSGLVRVILWGDGDSSRTHASLTGESALLTDESDAPYFLLIRAGTALAPGAVTALRHAFAEEAALSIAVPLLLERNAPQGLAAMGKPMAEIAQGLSGFYGALSPLPLAEPDVVMFRRDRVAVPDQADPAIGIFDAMLRVAQDGRLTGLVAAALADASGQPLLPMAAPQIIRQHGAMNVFTALALAWQNRTSAAVVDELNLIKSDAPYPFVSHAQNFEDIILFRALRDVARGMYLDVGASDPRMGSVSLAFHRRGWTGIHVEPLKEMAHKVRMDRPGDTIIEGVVGTAQGHLTFFNIGDGSGLSTLDRDVAERHRAAGFAVTERRVKSFTLADVMARHVTGDLHWLKIDVEGAEQDVLESWGDSPVRPWIIAVEATLPASPVQNHHGWEPIILARDYDFVFFDGLNRYYLAREQSHRKVFFDTPPNVFDQFYVGATVPSEPAVPFPTDFVNAVNSLKTTVSNVGGVK